MEQFFEILENCGCLDLVYGFLDLEDLCSVSRTCRFLRTSLSQDYIWRRFASKMWKEKKFVPFMCQRMIAPGNAREKRVDLQGLSVSGLKALCGKYRLEWIPGMEKKELVGLVAEYEEKEMYEEECLAKFAVRKSVNERTRRFITKDELCSFRWSHRIREDGPLGHLKDTDSWWKGGLCGTHVRL